MVFTTRGDALNTVTTDKGDWTSRKLTLLATGTEMDQQFCEFNLPETHPPVGVGVEVEIRVHKVTGVFQGNARIVGDLVKIGGKSVAPATPPK